MHWPRTRSLWKYTTRQVRRRPGRTLLTLLGIGIGVAAIVAIDLTVDTTTHAYRDMFAQVTDRAALEIVTEGLGAFDPASVAPARCPMRMVRTAFRWSSTEAPVVAALAASSSSCAGPAR